jgi:hypothetical protein
VIAPVEVQIERDFPDFPEKIRKIPPSIDANHSQQVHTITYQSEWMWFLEDFIELALASGAEWSLKY